MTGKSRYRCATYTRKSTEEGLEQDFNSLDAQREACAAFVASQAGLGWKLVSKRYDDGGVSGAEAIVGGRQPTELTAERLKRLQNLSFVWSEQRRALGFHS